MSGISLGLLAAPGHAFRSGCQALNDGRFEDAVLAFEAAAGNAPDSAEVQYNLGNAQYRVGDHELAAETFSYAASMTAEPGLQSRCWYNAGNCMVKLGEGVRGDDSNSALDYCRQAAWFYRVAVQLDRGNKDAAYNLEISQRLAVAISEEIQEEEDKEDQENDLMAYIRRKLEEFIATQTQLMNASGVDMLQRQLEVETRELVTLMEGTGLHIEIDGPGGEKLPGPLRDTWTHTRLAADAMAVPDQALALEELKKALGSAPESEDPDEGESDEEGDEGDYEDMDYEESDEDADMYDEADPFGDFSEYEEIRGVPPPNKTETDILAEEIRNQERRKQKKAGEYRAVQKDW